MDYKGEYVFDQRTTSLFPRMYSREPSHISAYKNWSGFVGKDVKVEDDNGAAKRNNFV